MTNKIFDYSKSKEDIFYKVIYPLYAREFLFGNNYEHFAVELTLFLMLRNGNTF
jgi:hypothetical protein